MHVRPPAVAGRFYPTEAEACVAAIAGMQGGLPQPEPALAGIVPHAGWVYSGRTALRTWQAVAAAKPEAVIVFGAVHMRGSGTAALDENEAWKTPLGLMPVDGELLRGLARSALVVVDGGYHAREHSIEVQVPLLQYLMPMVAFVPLAVPPTERAAEVGVHCADVIRACGRRVAIVASTDLTHYGPNYGFEPAGRGASGVRWAREVNDRRFLTAVAGMRAELLVGEAARHHNACGAGAVAALVAAARELGWGRFGELEHTSSAQVSGEPHVENSVGYAAGVFVG